MKIVVVGGTGLIGSKTVERLRETGHDVVAASPRSGVDTMTGDGLAGALAGAQIVIDLANSPSFEADAALAFFETSGRTLLAAEKVAGVGHHLALSLVGTGRLSENGYFFAKTVQESLIRHSGLPFTILRSTHSFEFIDAVVLASADGDVVRLSPALVQPVASDDIAAALADLAARLPLNGTVELAGPELYPLDQLGRALLAAHHDRRQVIADIHARYLGTELNDQSLTSSDHPRFAPTRFEEWLRGSLLRRQARGAAAGFEAWLDDLEAPMEDRTDERGSTPLPDPSRRDLRAGGHSSAGPAGRLCGKG
jgi:uncharacterized protein YbjT (DUF2867 family)